MLKNIFIVLIILISCGCVSDETKDNPTLQVNSTELPSDGIGICIEAELPFDDGICVETELPFDGICGKGYAIALRIETEWELFLKENSGG